MVMSTSAVDLKSIIGALPAWDRAIAELLRRLSPGFTSVPDKTPGR
jgi:hypothetical protein